MRDKIPYQRGAKLPQQTPQIDTTFLNMVKPLPDRSALPDSVNSVLDKYLESKRGKEI